MSSLYVNDLQVAMRHVNLYTIEREMQQCLNNIHQWTTEIHFRFSQTKTKIVHFTNLSGIHLNRPSLKLAGNIIPYANSVRFFGMILDSKLTWKQHINKMKADCTKLLGIMKSITSHSWGADQYSLMKINRMYIRSKLDYGSPISASASDTQLKILNSIATEAIRIATGAFKSTHVETLYVLANEMSLENRRKELSLRYSYKIKSQLDNPANKYLIPVLLRTLFQNKNIAQPLNLRIQNMLEEYNLRKHFVKPQFSYRMLGITHPTWSLKPPGINFELTKYPKEVTPPCMYKQVYQHLCHESYNNYARIFTDGSKSNNGVGAAIYYNGGKMHATLSQELSIFSAGV